MDEIEFTPNCREELDGHVNCVKLFLEQHAVHGCPYLPGSGDSRDGCQYTRSTYMKCMQYRKSHPPDASRIALEKRQPTEGPKPCEMELAMHGNCVANQLEKAQREGEKYWTEGGEDKCNHTRSAYERCIAQTKAGFTDRWGGDRLSSQLERNVSHLQVRLENK